MIFLCCHTWCTVLTYCQDTMGTLHKHVLPFLQNEYSLTKMSAGELQKFVSSFFRSQRMKKKMKEFTQSILWASKLEAVNLATSRKESWYNIDTNTHQTKLVLFPVLKLRHIFSKQMQWKVSAKVFDAFLIIHLPWPWVTRGESGKSLIYHNLPDEQ